MITMHPGKYFDLTVLQTFNMSQANAARRLGVTPATISRFVNGQADLSVEMALRLAHVFGRSPESWLRMQLQHTLATKDFSAVLAKLKRM